jgi:hypothetical protein
MQQPNSSIDDLLARFPKSERADWPKSDRDAAKEAEALLARGADAVAAVAAASIAPGDKQNQASFALAAAALFVSRRGAQAQRKAFSEGVLRCLANAPAAAKVFLIGQLQIACAAEATAVGSAPSVSSVSFLCRRRRSSSLSSVPLSATTPSLAAFSSTRRAFARASFSAPP